MSNKHKISVMISEDKLQEKIAEIGAKISADYEGKEIKLICILKGSIFFCCELAKRITVPVKIDFMQTSSYGSGTTSSGNIVIKKELDESIEETLEALEMIIEKMEDRDSSLEETFANYELGMKMVKSCSDQIDRVEKKIQVLAEESRDGEF